MMDGNFVIPGDFIGMSEEFTSGDGTYDDGGNIYASIVGVTREDKKERKIEVIPKTSVPSIIKKDDIVVGRISDLRENLVLVDIAYIKGREDRGLVNTGQGTIHISNVKDSYVPELKHEFDYMDIVRAVVIDEKAIRLSTVGKNFGVIKAICKRCRIGLRRKGNALECPKCGRVEMRHLSDDYGLGIL